MVLLHNLAQVEVICEAREDWWNALLRSSQLPGCVRRLAAPPGLHQLPHPPRRLPPQLQTRPRVLKDPFGEPACLAEEHDVANTDKLSVTYKAE